LNCFLFGTIGIGTWIIKAVKQWKNLLYWL
jgi:hypothetical protein